MRALMLGPPDVAAVCVRLCRLGGGARGDAAALHSWAQRACPGADSLRCRGSALECRVACWVSRADVLLGIGVQPGRRELEHGEGHVDDSCMPPMPAACVRARVALGRRRIASTEPPDASYAASWRAKLRLIARLVLRWHRRHRARRHRAWDRCGGPLRSVPSGCGGAHGALRSRPHDAVAVDDCFALFRRPGRGCEPS